MYDPTEANLGKVTMTMYAHKAGEWDDVPYKLHPWDMSDNGYVCLGPVEVTFTAPTTDPVDAELASIDKVMQSVRAEFQGKLSSLEQRKQELLALPGGQL